MYCVPVLRDRPLSHHPTPAVLRIESSTAVIRASDCVLPCLIWLTFARTVPRRLLK